MIFLTCESDCIKAKIGARVDAELRTEEEVDYYFRRYPNVPIYCSSSLDFPEEYTDLDTIKSLCDYIRK